MKKIRLTVSTDENGSLFIQLHNTVWGFSFTSDSLLGCSFLSFLHPWVSKNECCPVIALSDMAWEKYDYLSSFGYLRYIKGGSLPSNYQSFDKRYKRYSGGS